MTWRPRPKPLPPPLPLPLPLPTSHHRRPRPEDISFQDDAFLAADNASSLRCTGRRIEITRPRPNVAAGRRPRIARTYGFSAGTTPSIILSIKASRYSPQRSALWGVAPLARPTRSTPQRRPAGCGTCASSDRCQAARKCRKAPDWRSVMLHPSGAYCSREVRRRPTLPQGPPCSTIGAERLSFRVRNVTGRFPLAMTTGTPSTMIWSQTAPP